MASSRVLETSDLIIIGAGFGGLAMAIEARRAGRTVLILDKMDGLGGTWRANRYPGCCCDIPASLYSFSFAPGSSWSCDFPGPTEICAYQREVATRHGLDDLFRFGREVREACFDEDDRVWRIETTTGERFIARYLVSAVGQLGRPALPRVDGLASFEGEAMHTARWPSELALAGKRVAVIGTGASAIQVIPAIVDQVAELHVVQRSAPWILARGGAGPGSRRAALLRHVPLLRWLHRVYIFVAAEAAFAVLHEGSLAARLTSWWCRRTIAQQVHDPEIAARLTPDYPIGCKRILFSDNFYPTFNKPGVELHHDALTRVWPDGIELASGRRLALDVIVFATGFEATALLAPMSIRGRGGVSLHDRWAEGPAAYRGVQVPEFPNFFMLYGPNTNLGHNSILFMLEAQASYVRRAIEAVEAVGGDLIECTPEAYRADTEAIQRALSGRVWAACRSWYLDRSGRNVSNWPHRATAYWWKMRRLARRDQIVE